MNAGRVFFRLFPAFNRNDFALWQRYARPAGARSAPFLSNCNGF